MFFNLVFFFAIPLILFKIISFKLRKPKNLPPGPQALPLLGHLHLLKRPVHRTLHELSQKYGQVMFLQFGVRRVVVVSSPKAAEECFTKNDIIFANRPQMVAGKLLNYNSSTIGLSSYGDHWRNLRRITALEVLSQSRLAEFSNIRQEEVHFLLKELYEECHDFKPIKVALKSKFLYLTLNIMTRMIAGKRYYRKDVLNGEARQFQEVINDMVEFHGAINLEDYLPVLQWIDVNGLKKRMVVVMKKMDRLFQNLINERRKIRSGSTPLSDVPNRKEETKRTVIDILISLQDIESESITDQTVKSIMLVRSSCLSCFDIFSHFYRIMMSHTILSVKKQKIIFLSPLSISNNIHAYLKSSTKLCASTTVLNACIAFVFSREFISSSSFPTNTKHV